MTDHTATGGRPSPDGPERRPCDGCGRPVRRPFALEGRQLCRHCATRRGQEIGGQG